MLKNIQTIVLLLAGLLSNCTNLQKYNIGSLYDYIESIVCERVYYLIYSLTL